MGEMVWAYHPSRKATTPPAAEWNVPHDGAIDPTFTVTADRSLVAKKDKAISSSAVAEAQASTPRKQVRPQNALAKAAAAAATNVAKTSDNFQEKLKKESKDNDKKDKKEKDKSKKDEKEELLPTYETWVSHVYCRHQACVRKFMFIFLIRLACSREPSASAAGIVNLVPF